MAKADYENDSERGQPVELYLFIYGKDPSDDSDLYYAYTTAEKPITHDDGVRGPITYQNLEGLDRTSMKVAGKPDKQELDVTVPRTSEIARLFQPYPPTQTVSLIIREGHIANLDDPASYATGELFPVSWIGRALESVRNGANSKINCESGTASMKRMGLRRHYQWSCPWKLYGTRCGADRVAATTATTVGSFTGASVTPADGLLWLPVDRAFADYAGGEVEWQGDSGLEKRRILRIDDTTSEIFLAGPVRDLAVSDDINIILGCKRTVNFCETVHGRIVSYGGCPGIPTFNPAGKNNHT